MMRSEKARGLAILGLTFVLALLVSWLVKRSVHTDPGLALLAPPLQTGLAGFPQAFEPLAALEQARGLSVRDGLLGIVLTGVSATGTVDLTNGQGSVRYALGSRRGEGPQPPVPPGERRRRDYCGRQDVVVDDQGMRAQADASDHSCSGLSGWLPDPVCTLPQLLQHAQKKGAPKDALAQIEYYPAKAGPAWRIRVAGDKRAHVLYGDCKRALESHAAQGHVP